MRLPGRSWRGLGLVCWVLSITQVACSREAKPAPAISAQDGAAAAPKSSSGASFVDASVSVRDAGAAEVAGQPPAQVPLVRERRELMSTIYEISVVSSDDSRARETIERALTDIARLERELSEWIPESDISRINAAAGKTKVQVGPDTLANVQAALDAAKRTGGAFDPTWAALRPFYLFQPGEKKVPDVAAVRKQKHLVNYRDVVVDAAGSTVFLKRKGMALGLGGIAKGWAVDRASAILIEAGFPNHMVFAGGQVLVRGLKGDRKWRVGIQHPRMAGYIGFIELTDASIATAGDYEHSFIADDGTHWHHIIDPETALPARRSTSVTLVAPNGLIADALDTGCFVMGPEKCLKMLAEYPEPIEAVIIDDQLKLFATPGTREKIVMRMAIDSEGRIPIP
ncbi:MAG: FAD:protein FMN transferase [Myxococcales bacterium]